MLQLQFGFMEQVELPRELTADNVRLWVQVALEMLVEGLDTADQVARRLKHAKCLAFSWPHLTIYCPVTRWLWGHVPWEPEDGLRIQVGSNAVHAGGAVMLLPKLVRLFARGYDDGLYPELVDDPRRLWVR